MLVRAMLDNRRFLHVDPIDDRFHVVPNIDVKAVVLQAYHNNEEEC